MKRDCFVSTVRQDAPHRPDEMKSGSSSLELLWTFPTRGTGTRHPETREHTHPGSQGRWCGPIWSGQAIQRRIAVEVSFECSYQPSAIITEVDVRAYDVLLSMKFEPPHVVRWHGRCLHPERDQVRLDHPGLIEQIDHCA